LVRTPACHAGGREFESRRSRHLGWMLGGWKTKMLFQDEKSVLPGSGILLITSLFFFDKQLCNLFQTVDLFITIIT
jgi:hypothetical protein